MLQTQINAPDMIHNASDSSHNAPNMKYNTSDSNYNVPDVDHNSPDCFSLYSLSVQRNDRTPYSDVIKLSADIIKL